MFDFGENWKSYSKTALNQERAEAAKADFKRLVQGIDLKSRSFLDIGFGQGLGLLSAADMGASIVGNDINPKCGEALEVTRRFFPRLNGGDTPLVIGSILDEESLVRLRNLALQGYYDVVHSWGVLQFTGDMNQGIRNAASLVAPGGYLILAIYARHWSSPAWKIIKRFYNWSPKSIKNLMIAVLAPVIWLAKLLVTRKNPSHKERGMDFMHDVVDWVGGYPYEYASMDEVISMVEGLGFSIVRTTTAQVPTGCNEFVFRRNCQAAEEAKCANYA